MDTTCVICDRPVDGVAYACQAEADKAAKHLATIADLAGDARAVAHGQTSRGPSGAGGGSGERRLPVNLAATSRLDAVQGELTTLVRAVAAERGRVVPQGGDPISIAATWLSGHLEWIRHHPAVDEMLSTIATCAKVIAGIVSPPSSRRWLGQCGTPGPDGDCQLDVNARRDATSARCRCGATVVVADRLADLADLVRGYSYTAAEIADAYPEIRAGRIRQWAHRGRIVATGEMGGRPVYDLGEVIDRARVELLRRAERQAREAEQRDHAESEVDDAA